MNGDIPLLHTKIEEKYARKIVRTARVKKDLEACIASFDCAIEMFYDLHSKRADLKAFNAEYPRDSIKLQSLFCNGFVSYGRVFVDSAVSHTRLYSGEEGEKFLPLHKYAMEVMRHGYYAHTNVNVFDEPIVAATFFPGPYPQFFGMVSNLNFSHVFEDTLILDMLEMAKFAYSKIENQLKERLDDLERMIRTRQMIPTLANKAVYATQLPAPPRPPTIGQ